MVGQEILWVALFLTSFSLMLGALIISYVFIRDFFTQYDWRRILFAVGFLVAMGSNLFLALNNSFEYIGISFILLVLGYLFIMTSLLRRMGGYLFYLISVVLIIAFWNPVFRVAILILIFIDAYLAFKNYCLLFCNQLKKCLETRKRIKEGKEWGLVFVFLFLAEVARFSSGNISKLFIIIFSILAAAIIYYHILCCIKFSKREKVLFPLMISFVISLVMIGFFVNFTVTDYLKNNLEGLIKRDLETAKYIAEMTYPDGELANRIKAKDPNLNNLVDKIFAVSGTRVTFFLRDERIAATPSTSGKGRLLGTIVGDQGVKEMVLGRGDEYVGTIKGKKISSLVAYAPIYSGNEVIGMISAEEPMSFALEIKNTLFFKIVLGTAIVLFFNFLAIVYGPLRKF